jgi:hypothetical protein
VDSGGGGGFLNRSGKGSVDGGVAGRVALPRFFFYTVSVWGGAVTTEYGLLWLHLRIVVEISSRIGSSYTCPNGRAGLTRPGHD